MIQFSDKDTLTKAIGHSYHRYLVSYKDWGPTDPITLKSKSATMIHGSQRASILLLCMHWSVHS